MAGINFKLDGEKTTSGTAAHFFSFGAVPEEVFLNQLIFFIAVNLISGHVFSFL